MINRVSNLRKTIKRWKTRSASKPVSGSIFKASLIKALATAMVGYFFALIISPEQLYRIFFLPDPNDFSGEWNGQVGGFPASLTLLQTALTDSKKPIKITGTLKWKQREIKMTGNADSNFILTGDFGKNKILLLSLVRQVPDVRSYDDEYLLLYPYKDAVAARICPKFADVLDIINIEKDCTELTGITWFFKRG